MTDLPAPPSPPAPPAGSQRLFFALWPDPAVRAALTEAMGGLPRQGRGRLVHPEELHLTLLFLGEVAPERLPCLMEAAEATRGATFDLAMDRLECWGRGGILWCGPLEAPPALLDLFADLQQRVAACGFPPERRAFRAHLTLARDARPRAAQALERPIHWPVREFVLVRSDLGGKPPRYRVLKRWPLECQTQV